MNVYVVGRIRPGNNDGEWELMGVFSTEEKALEAATLEGDFIGPTDLDFRWPEDRMSDWPGSYFPNAE